MQAKCEAIKQKEILDKKSEEIGKHLIDKETLAKQVEEANSFKIQELKELEGKKNEEILELKSTKQKEIDELKTSMSEEIAKNTKNE